MQQALICAVRLLSCCAQVYLERAELKSLSRSSVPGHALHGGAAAAPGAPVACSLTPLKLGLEPYCCYGVHAGTLRGWRRRTSGRWRRW